MKTTASGLIKMTTHLTVRKIQEGSVVWGERENDSHPTGAAPANVSPTPTSESGSPEGITSNHTTPSDIKDTIDRGKSKRQPLKKHITRV